jgi:cob(I)alamin adenosyltransferase
MAWDWAREGDQNPFPKSEDPKAQEVINSLNLANQALINEVQVLRAAQVAGSQNEVNRINNVLLELQKDLATMTKARDLAVEKIKELQAELHEWEKGSEMLPGNRLDTVD